MRFDRMIVKSQEAFAEVQSLCDRERHSSMEGEHLTITFLPE